MLGCGPFGRRGTLVGRACRGAGRIGETTNRTRLGVILVEGVYDAERGGQLNVMGCAVRLGCGGAVLDTTLEIGVVVELGNVGVGWSVCEE